MDCVSFKPPQLTTQTINSSWALEIMTVCHIFGNQLQGYAIYPLHTVHRFSIIHLFIVRGSVHLVIICN